MIITTMNANSTNSNPSMPTPYKETTMSLTLTLNSKPKQYPAEEATGTTTEKATPPKTMKTKSSAPNQSNQSNTKPGTPGPNAANPATSACNTDPSRTQLLKKPNTKAGSVMFNLAMQVALKKIIII